MQLVHKTIELFLRFRRYFIFIAGGGVGALVNWLISFVLTSLLGIRYDVSFAIAQIPNIAVNFLWHRHITFKVTDHSAGRSVKFFLVSILTALLSIQLVRFTKELVLDRVYTIIIFGLDLNYLAVIIFITFVVSVLNYLINKVWIFNKGTVENNNKGETA